METMDDRNALICVLVSLYVWLCKVIWKYSSFRRLMPTQHSIGSITSLLVCGLFNFGISLSVYMCVYLHLGVCVCVCHIRKSRGV